jgi:hypothetical protein
MAVDIETGCPHMFVKFRVAAYIRYADWRHTRGSAHGSRDNVRVTLSASADNHDGSETINRCSLLGHRQPVARRPGEGSHWAFHRLSAFQ